MSGGHSCFTTSPRRRFYLDSCRWCKHPSSNLLEKEPRQKSATEAVLPRALARRNSCRSALPRLGAAARRAHQVHASSGVPFGGYGVVQHVPQYVVGPEEDRPAPDPRESSSQTAYDDVQGTNVLWPKPEDAQLELRRRKNESRDRRQDHIRGAGHSGGGSGGGSGRGGGGGSHGEDSSSHHRRGGGDGKGGGGGSHTVGVAVPTTAVEEAAETEAAATPQGLGHVVEHPDTRKSDGFWDTQSGIGWPQFGGRSRRTQA